LKSKLEREPKISTILLMTKNRDDVDWRKFVPLGGRREERMTENLCWQKKSTGEIQRKKTQNRHPLNCDTTAQTAI